MTEEVLYTTGPVHVIDLVRTREDGVVVGVYGGRTVAELEAKYGTGKVLRATMDEYMKLHDADWRTEPAPISEERWDYYLGVLPPHGWGRTDGVESFKVEETISGRMTTICARKGERFWSFVDYITLPAREIAARINALPAS